MGKHLHGESDSYKQSGCMWGIVDVLNYHQWQSSVKKIIPHRKYHGRSPLQCEWSPDTSVDSRDGYEKLIDQEKSPRHGSKKSRSAKKRSLRARFKAMIFEETSMDDNDQAKSSLQRTYSIHHLESVDDLFGKIRKDWTHPIIFLPRNSEDYSDAAQSKKATIKEECDCHSPTDSKVRADIFDIFKVDKEVFLKNLQDSDEGVANFSRSAFGLKTKGKFSRSRSFPVAELGDRRKLKPLKIESKQKEVWRFPSTSLSAEPKKSADRWSSENLDYREEDSAVDRTDDDDDGGRKHTHRRSSSLNESMDKYTRLFENSLGKDVKLSSSKSLKLTSEYAYAPPKFKRIRSLSNADSYCSSISFEVSGENPPGTSLVVIEEDSSSGVHNSEEEATLHLNTNMETREDDDSLRLEESNDEFKNDESLEEIQEQFFVSDSEILLKKVESVEAEIQLPKGKDQESRIHNLENFENHEIKEKISYPQKKSSDLDYVRHLLERSEIAVDASEMTWHASDQLLSPQLFEDIEGGWPHEEDELDGYPDFRGCWHHQMLFNVVNDVLLEVYDISLPYYPKALSSNCHVPPFPMGNHIIEEVCTSIGSLMNVAPEEKQLLDSIVGRDLGRDRGWMNLQLESESVALYLEELIFDELVEEVMFS